MSRRKKQVVSDLLDLSRAVPPPEEQELMWERLEHETDRSAAIWAGAHVELILREAIRTRLADPGPQLTESWFIKEGAPFSTFAAKIHLGRGLVILGPKTERYLKAIKDIRNAFAHSVHHLTFGHKAIIDRIRILEPEEIVSLSAAEARSCYIDSCSNIANELIDYAKKHSGENLGFPPLV
ncbi:MULTISPECIES: hypothetical protein [Pacificimonas]|uniref:MAE-28990/MAE-18760-like HEPN domain-containing protein n=1 Tax=Pacificimonas aurantium TaxID=1250540 RepID=A0ABS7WMA6_9SPHN|nr:MULTISPECIES: hypothetical protein [Pacificimonas]MBZ6379084.1 hypothetical protein [Pacificimonas aurantium]